MRNNWWVNILAALAVIVAISLFGKNWVFLFLLLILIAWVRQVASPIKNSLVWFIVCAILGSVSEMLMMTSGLWQYSQKQLYTIPYWLPLAWGNAGSLMVGLYRFFESGKEKG